MSAEPLTTSAYIQHHLLNLKLNLTNFTISGTGGFWTLNLDTLGVSIFLGLTFLVLFRIAARHATAGVPGRLQNFVELMVEFADAQVKDTFHGRSKLI